MAKKPSGKPTGLKIERDGLNFTFSWKKRGGNYDDGQKLEYKIYTAKSQEVADSGRLFLSQGFEISGTKWTPISIGSNVDHYKLTSLSANSFYPAVVNSKRVETRLYGIAFRVKGNTEKTKKDTGWSDWSTKTMVIQPPAAPSITASWDSDNSNRSTYDWSAPSNSKDKKPVTNVEYQTIVKQDCPKDYKGLPEWDSASSSTKSLTGSNYHDETGLSGVSKTRVVRVRARGIGGYSSWAYASHVFAAPYAADITDCKALYNATTHVWDISAVWDTPKDAGHPVDSYMLQYRIGKPVANMGVTSDNSWQDTSPTTAGDIAVQFTDAISDDECLWLRVAASHDNHSGANAIVGTAVRAYTGKPAAPTNLTISASDVDTRTVTIAVTNNSAITDAKVAVVFQPSTNPKDSVIVAVLTGSGSISQSGIKCPDWSGTGTLGFRAFAYVGSESYTTGSDSVKRYNVIPVMQSDDAFTSGGIPKAPATVTAVRNGKDIEVSWAWTWEEANGAEVSWATKKNAWESNDEPDTYIVSSTGPAHLYISEPGMGLIYYVKVRLLYDNGEDITYGPYSKMVTVYLTEAPQVPVLDVSTDALKPGDEFTCSWTYVSMDGTDQAHANVYEVLSNPTSYSKIAEADSAQHVTFNPGWTAGTQHKLVVEVTSESGETSKMSDAVVVTVVTPPTCTITQASLAAGADGYELQQMDLTVTITGAGTAGQTTLEIIRTDDFVQDRPDESDFTGYVGEVITRRIYAGEAQQTITLDDLIPGTHLDDTARYRIVARVTDGYNQTDDDALDFTVAWSQKAVEPEADVEIVGTAAYISFTKPAGAANTDRLDLYRLSNDKPELIYRDALFTDVVVDPYPAIGAYGGYRVVLKTKNGDSTMLNGGLAWLDVDAGFESPSQLIDFDGYTLPLSYNVKLDSGWKKDFQKTKYLGGHEEGDWLEGVSRSGSISSALLTEDDAEDISVLRRLAVYSGPAHIRSKDGSSYTANVNVSNDTMQVGGGYRSITLSIESTRAAQLDGVLQADWEA